MLQYNQKIQKLYTSLIRQIFVQKNNPILIKCHCSTRFQSQFCEGFFPTRIYLFSCHVITPYFHRPFSGLHTFLFSSNSGDLMELHRNSVAIIFFFRIPTSSISWNVSRNIKSIYRIALFDYSPTIINLNACKICLNFF